MWRWVSVTRRTLIIVGSSARKHARCSGARCMRMHQVVSDHVLRHGWPMVIAAERKAYPADGGRRLTDGEPQARRARRLVMCTCVCTECQHGGWCDSWCGHADRPRAYPAQSASTVEVRKASTGAAKPEVVVVYRPGGRGSVHVQAPTKGLVLDGRQSGGLEFGALARGGGLI